jgi:hypothetical protein
MYYKKLKTLISSTSGPNGAQPIGSNQISSNGSRRAASASIQQ